MYNGTLTLNNQTISGSDDIFFTKRDTSGTTDWLTHGGGTTSADHGRVIRMDDNGKLFLLGNYRNHGVLDTMNLGTLWCKSRFFIARFNNLDGHVIEYIDAGGIDDGDEARAMVNTDDNQLLIAGSAYDFGQQGVDFGSFTVYTGSGGVDFLFAKTKVAEVKSKIKGMVFKNNIPVYSTVELFRLTPQFTTEYIVSKTSVNGQYEFDVFVKGKYLIKSRYFLNDYVSTYYGQTYVWTQAQQVEITSDSILSNMDIHLIQIPQQSGPNIITGHVYDQDSLPLRFIDILITDIADSLVASVKSDTSGLYRIDSIPNGTYKILLDTTGVDLTTYYTLTVTGKTNKTHSGYDFYIIDNQVITLQNISIDERDHQELIIYPVPTRERLHIDLRNPGEKAIVRMFDDSGKQFREEKIHGSLILDVSDLKSGIYIVEVQMKTGIRRFKILIE